MLGLATGQLEPPGEVSLERALGSGMGHGKSCRAMGQHARSTLVLRSSRGSGRRGTVQNGVPVIIPYPLFLPLSSLTHVCRNFLCNVFIFNAHGRGDEEARVIDQRSSL